MILSIILPTKDRPKLLPRAIESVMAQTDDRWELVVYDNGAEPAMTLAPLEMPEDRYRYVYGPANGPADAFQKALDLATGDVVMPMGDDDTLAPTAVRVVLEGIGEAQWGYAQTAFQQDTQTAFLLGEPWSLERMRQDMYLGGAVFWRRSLTDRLGGFDEEYDGAADYDLYLRFGEDSEPVFIPEIIYRYNDHPHTDSNANSPRQRDAAARIRRRAPRRRVAVITPWLGHPELIPFYAQSVERADQVIIIDNGDGPSGEQLSPALVKIITPDEALGFAAANNEGWAHVEDGIDIVLFLNNDVQATSDWLDALRSDVQDGGLYGPFVGKQTIKGIGIPYIEGWCVAATIETWQDLERSNNTLWDQERFPRAYWEDVELSMRAVRQGIELRKAPWRIRHIGGQTTIHTPGMTHAIATGRKVIERDLEELLAWQS